MKFLKNVVYLALLAVTTSLTSLAAVNGRRSHKEEVCFQKVAHKLIDTYTQNPADLKEYMSLYKSSYQAFPPQPAQQAFAQLTPNDQELAKALHELGGTFKRDTSRMRLMPGSSTLSEEGVKFYEDVIDYLEKKSS